MEGPEGQVRAAWPSGGVHHDAKSHHLLCPTASSVSSFRINGNELVNGVNIISLTITGESGVSRTSTLTLRRTVTTGRQLYVPDYKSSTVETQVNVTSHYSTS